MYVYTHIHRVNAIYIERDRYTNNIYIYISFTYTSFLNAISMLYHCYVAYIYIHVYIYIYQYTWTWVVLRNWGSQVTMGFSTTMVVHDLDDNWGSPIDWMETPIYPLTIIFLSQCEFYGCTPIFRQTQMQILLYIWIILFFIYICVYFLFIYVFICSYIYIHINQIINHFFFLYIRI